MTTLFHRNKPDGDGKHGPEPGEVSLDTGEGFGGVDAEDADGHLPAGEEALKGEEDMADLIAMGEGEAEAGAAGGEKFVANKAAGLEGLAELLPAVLAEKTAPVGFGGEDVLARESGADEETGKDAVAGRTHEDPLATTMTEGVNARMSGWTPTGLMFYFRHPRMCLIQHNMISGMR